MMSRLKPVVPPSFLLRCWKCGSTEKCAVQEVGGYIEKGWPKSKCCRTEVGLFMELERPVSDQLLVAKVTELQERPGS
jgi:hypothetical protein